MDLTLFNPHSQSEADFVSGFVARQDPLEYFVRQFRSLGAREAAAHHLIRAPRGFGKTSLLRRIAIELRTDEDLSQRYVALTFREEQHNVISLDVFWRNCLQSLLEAREDEGAPEAELDELDYAWQRLSPRQELKREEQSGEPAWTEFHSRCRALSRRPVLFLDNLDTLLAGMSEQHQWALRARLQEVNGPVVLAATSRPQLPQAQGEKASF